MQNDTFISIREVATILGVSLDTLRRWDKKGSLRAIRTPGGHRLYRRDDILSYTKNMVSLAKKWVVAEAGDVASDQSWYCENGLIFQTKLAWMEKELMSVFPEIDWISLVVATTGEIGNNSFDHNLGNWRDVPGVFFGFDTYKRHIVLADRGQGVLKTLSRVRPELNNDADALRVAFTEVVSGRAPEARGNGLKLVRTITEQYAMNVDFCSGRAEVILRHGKSMKIIDTAGDIHGSLAIITF